MEHNQPKLLTIDKVIKFTSLSRSTIYQLVKDGDFPPQIKLSRRRVAWRVDDLNEWLEKAA